MAKNLREISAGLGALTDEELVAVFQEVFSGRPKAAPAPWLRSHYFVGVAYQLDESEDALPRQWSNWKISAIAKPDPIQYGHDSKDLFVGAEWGFCQEAECTCGYHACSNMKQGICQICGKNVYMT